MRHKGVEYIISRGLTKLTMPIEMRNYSAVSVVGVGMTAPNFSKGADWVGDNLRVMRGWIDHFEDLQLLCTHCNRSKSSKTMAEWRAGQSA